MPLDIIITTGGNDPIFKQIKDQIKLSIANQSMAMEEKLPSVRELSQRLLVNVNTVAKAYNELVKEGVVESRHGKGVFVMEQRHMLSNSERKSRLDHAINAFISETLPLAFTNQELLEETTKKLKQLGNRKNNQG